VQTNVSQPGTDTLIVCFLCFSTDSLHRLRRLGHTRQQGVGLSLRGKSNKAAKDAAHEIFGG
jgi:hypothetical protein